MSTEVTTDKTAHENGNAQPAVDAPVVDKGKGKAVEPAHDEDMDDEEDDEEEEVEEDDDDDLVPEEPLDVTLIVSQPRRRAQVDYSSKEALAKAGLAPEPEEDEEDEFMAAAEDDE